ncbi:cell division protein ZapA [Pseudoxanthomonas suwonensis]
MSTEPVEVRILDREYTVGVPAGERDSLQAAARLLDSRMREIRGSNRMVSLDRLAVLAALNLAHELHQAREERDARERELTRVLDTLERRLDGLLGPATEKPQD